MATVNVNVRIDAKLKQSADEAMQIAGTTPTQAITLLYQYIAENKTLPFVEIRSVKTPADLAREGTLSLSEALAVVLNMQAWISQHGEIPAVKMRDVVSQIEYFSSNSRTSIHLEGNQDFVTAQNNIKKIRSIIMELGSCYSFVEEIIKLSPYEKECLDNAVQNFKNSVFFLVKKYNTETV